MYNNSRGKSLPWKVEAQASNERSTQFSVLKRPTIIETGLKSRRDSQHTHVSSIDEDGMEGNIHDIDNECNNDEQPDNTLNGHQQEEQEKCEKMNL